jgi:hypothetical protein
VVDELIVPVAGAWRLVFAFAIYAATLPSRASDGAASAAPPRSRWPK